MNIINSYNFFLDSSQRTSGTTDYPTFNLLRPITLTSPANYFTVRIGSAEIPYNFTLINNQNNTINYNFVKGFTAVNSSITLINGNYNILSLLQEISDELKTSIQTQAGFTPNLNFTYNKNSGKATFSIIGNDGIATFITIQNNSPRVLECLGFTNSFIFSYNSSNISNDAISTQNVNVSQINALYIRSDSLLQAQNFEALIEPIQVSDILAKVQITSLPQTYITWVNPTDLVVKINNRIIDTISLYLSSSISYYVDLGNLDWSLRLTVSEVSPLEIEKHSFLMSDKISDFSDPNIISENPQPQSDIDLLESYKKKIVKRLLKLKNKLGNNKDTQNAEKTESKDEI